MIMLYKYRKKVLQHLNKPIGISMYIPISHYLCIITNIPRVILYIPRCKIKL